MFGNSIMAWSLRAWDCPKFFCVFNCGVMNTCRNCPKVMHTNGKAMMRSVKRWLFTSVVLRIRREQMAGWRRMPWKRKLRGDVEVVFCPLAPSLYYIGYVDLVFITQSNLLLVIDVPCYCGTGCFYIVLPCTYYPLSGWTIHRVEPVEMDFIPLNVSLGWKEVSAQMFPQCI